MALVDFQSRYSFYTSQPPAVDYIGNTDAKGFITEKQPQGASDFVGILGSNAVGFKYEHTGIRNLGNMSTNLRPLNQDGNPARDTFVRGSVGNFTTRYQNNADDIPSITARGFERDGVSSIVISRTAKDEFPIDDVTFSDRGIAKRRAQLGDGSKFPIGPAGQVHNFDIIRTGFNDQSRYGDTYGPKSNSGLADTYTANSPIDDLYNKYKVRDEAHNPFTFPFTREPFILRGIQRDDNSKPQRWGLSDTVGGTISSTLNIPRGGPLTFIGRTLFDVARLGKFILSPKGLIYTAKQFGLQFMNPNVEDAFGAASRRPRLTQLYDPASFIVNAATAGIGIRFDRHGLPLGLFPKRGKYEEVFKTRRAVANLPEDADFPIADNAAIDFNRLNRLRLNYGLDDVARVARGFTFDDGGNAVPSSEYLPIGAASGILTAAGGPQSILGIGRTRISRGDNTAIIYKNALGVTHGWGSSGPSRALGDRFANDIKGRQNDVASPYVRPGKTRQDMDDGSGIRLTNEVPQGSTLFSSNVKSALRIYHNSLAKALEKNNLWLDHTGITSTTTEDENKWGGGVSYNKDASGIPVTGNKRFATLNYELIRRIAKGRTPNSTTVTDFVMSRINNRPTDMSLDANDAPRYYMYEKAYSRYRTTTKRFRGRTEDDEMILIALGEYKRDDPGSSKAFPFNAYIISLSDSFNPSYKNDNDIGVPIPRYQMESYSRTISMEILTAAENTEHLDNIWENISGAAQKATPSGSAPFSGRTLKLTIGRLYRNLTVVMKAFTVSFDNETLWDIRPGVELPKYASISMEFDVLSTGVHYPGTNGEVNAVSDKMIQDDKTAFENQRAGIIDPTVNEPPVIVDDDNNDDFFFS